MERERRQNKVGRGEARRRRRRRTSSDSFITRDAKKPDKSGSGKTRRRARAYVVDRADPRVADPLFVIEHWNVVCLSVGARVISACDYDERERDTTADDEADDLSQSSIDPIRQDFVLFVLYKSFG